MSMLRKTIGVLALSTVIGLPQPTPSVAAQAKSKTRTSSKADSSKATRSASKSKKERRQAKARLPRYYAQLELDAEQREEIMTIQLRFNERLAKLNEQMDKLAVDRDKELQSVLKTAQRRKLKRLAEK